MKDYGAIEILFHPAEFQRLYNCSAYSIDDIPLEARQHPITGAVYVILFLIYQSCHLLCLPAIRTRMKDSSCYKIMFFMSALDVTALPVIALGSGIFMFTGTVFCSSPTLMYSLAICTPFWWYGETMAALVLALNRCVDLMSRDWSESLFKGSRTWTWIAATILYGIHHVVFTKSVIFSGVIGCWHFNPHIGYLQNVDHNYNAQDLLEHNIIVLLGLSSLYGTFCLRIFWSRKKDRADGAGWDQQVNVKALFLQVLLISISHLMTAFIYVFMHYVYASPAIASFAQLVWISAHGLPGVVYLTMNASIRKDVKKMLGIRVQVTTETTFDPSMSIASGPQELIVGESYEMRLSVASRA